MTANTTTRTSDMNNKGEQPGQARLSLRRLLAVSRNDTRMMRRDPVPLVVMVLMPLVLITFVLPLYRLAMQREGYPHANGADLAVPGLAVMFSFFLVSHTAYGVFREHGWRTWDRLRVTPLWPAETVCGKALPLLVFAVVQQAALFSLGAALFGLRMPPARVPLWLVVSVPLGIILVAAGVALASVCRTVHQVNAFGNVATVVLGGIGGALVPSAQMPALIQHIAPATPTYWAVQGYRLIVLGTGDTGAVLRCSGVLCAFAAALVLVAVLTLRVGDRKVHWT